MSSPDEFSFHRYLTAKRTVDDRALHRPTLDCLTDGLHGDGPAALDVADRPLRVLEVAAGVGTGLQRLLAWDVLPPRVDYTLLDSDESNVTAARERVAEWARGEGYDVERSDDSLALARDDERVTVSFVVADALAYADSLGTPVDLLVGQAFVDLVDLDSGLPALFDLVADGGLAYFPITFDGVTGFAPPAGATDVPSDFEERLLDVYHATMDASGRPGSSTTGRALLTAVGDAGGDVVAAGGSDWLVHPPYPADEAYFLHHLIDTVAGAVADDGGLDADDDGLDADALTAWTAARHDAVARGELTFFAHNLDVLARVE
ncbi:hypothetical protein SAMN04487949_1309 [Halogranum gelatinilyticum]|uniref:Methyltransferase domain-containing protein n=1 Tax=Halogranum gelatinilyticum TaxID=660521 RepID=A0A1G9REP5_9EURY|nr:hypothetical protein [Halogranum gelatinilyticum]SDM21738.1 hypothetical protein SAMN04487949_1309 [Halogranum gelatinilyticum]